RTWEHWQTSTAPAATDPAESAPAVRPIDIEDYLAIGGMAHALSRHADEAYAALPDDRARAIAQVAFQCLSGRDPTGHEARHPTSVATIAEVAKVDPASVINVINHFRQPAHAFLMTSANEIGPESIIDISHESLIRGWGLLRNWAEAESE